MKFMKLGSKPDLFHTDGDNIRYVATELATDVVVTVGDVKFYLHKFPLLSKSARLQNLISSSKDDKNDEICIHDIPGGPTAFEICAKFCYGMTVTLNAYNVIAAYCAAEYLEMHEAIEKGNLIYKIEVFLNSSIFRSWKDSIIVLQTTKSLLPWSEELKVVSRCLDSIASKASVDTSKVDWSYTYNRKKLPSENGDDNPHNSLRKQHVVPKDWWVEDLCDLQIDMYKRVITTIKTKGKIPGFVIGEALKAYVLRRGMVQNVLMVETIVSLLPTEKNSTECCFLLKLLQSAIHLDCGEMVRRELMKKIGQQLEEATVDELLIRSPAEETTIYNVDIVQSLVEEFVKQEQNEYQEIGNASFLSDASKVKVAELVDGYLTEVAKDPDLPLAKFVDLAQMVSDFSRPSHDGIYRAIDTYLKEHPEIGKSEKKRICKLMDCKKLSADACMHAVQNERLPLRVVVQVLFFEHVRATTTTTTSSGGGSTPELPRAGESHNSSRSTLTNTEEEDWAPVADELKALKGELANIRLRDEDSKSTKSTNKVKSLLMSKTVFSKLWSRKDGGGRENSSSETSESPASTSIEETKSASSRSKRHSTTA